MVDTLPTVFDRIRMQGNPLSNPASTVLCGQARFTILTPRLIRLEWSASAQFEDRGTFAFPNRYAEPPKVSHRINGDVIEINTDALTLRYAADGKPFNPTNLSVAFNLDGQRITWTPGNPATGNLRGTQRTLDQAADAVSLQEGLLSRDGWTLFDDSGSAVWDIDQRWVEARPDDHVQDWYFFGYGHDYKALLADYVRFGGPIPLVPRYVLGAWWSRFWAYSDNDLLQLVDDFTAHDIPLDVLVVDMDWHTPDGWTGYTWNRQLFPDPEGFLAKVHAQDLYVTLNLHPAEGIQKHEAAYSEFAERLGMNPANGDGIKFNSTDKAFVQNYFELLHHPMEEQGVDFWWLDWQQGEATDVKNLDPLPWLNHLHFRDAIRRGKRPMLYSRWGGLGNHRYPIGFSGDTYATWASLAFQPYFTATAANVCYGWWSHDIGGHFGATDPELYARWVQYGAVSPCLRLHSTKDPLAERRPWAFPDDVYAATKAAMQFRYRLFPYLYSASHSAGQQGLSLCYPMYYEYPDTEDAYLARGQYFLGDQMFAAPIVSPLDPQTGLASIDVWIPDGTWIEYTTLETFSGPQWVRILADLNRIPLFVRASAILPLAPHIMRTHEFDGSHLVIEVFPVAPGSNGAFTLYEDDGATEAYQHDEYETTTIRTMQPDPHTLAISIGGAEGSCAGLPAHRKIELHVRGVAAPAQVAVNGIAHAGWHYAPATSDLAITISNVDRRMPLEVVASAVATPTAASSADPFVHVLDYETFDDASLHAATVIVVPATGGTPFDAEITWRLERDGTTTRFPAVLLNHCDSCQIVHSPFADNGSFATFRWSVDVTITSQSHSISTGYHSRDAYPSVNHWQTLVYNRDSQPHTLADVTAAEGSLNSALNWQAVMPSLKQMLNIRQPFGLVLLERDRQRITSGDVTEACVSSALFSEAAQDVMLYVQSVGGYIGYLNGVELVATDPIPHAPLQPMYYSWMTPAQTYYRVHLEPGANHLIVFTRPTTEAVAGAGWWGFGATVFDNAGNIVNGLSSGHESGVA